MEKQITYPLIPAPSRKNRALQLSVGFLQPTTEQRHLSSYQISSHIPYLLTFFIEDVNPIQQQHNPYH
jgi:hypothetical protein